MKSEMKKWSDMRALRTAKTCVGIKNSNDGTQGVMTVLALNDVSIEVST